MGLRVRYLKHYFHFASLSKKDSRFKLTWRNRFPCIYDNTSETSYDRHYVYHPAWAARILKQINPKQHVDVSSSLAFSSMLSAFIPTTFYDYRPADLVLTGLQSLRGDLLHLPLESGSLETLSCMHVVEHVGLGRYGDPMNPTGDLEAIAELKRVVKPGGHMLFVVPVGNQNRLMFNAHRIYSPAEVISYFKDQFELKEFALIPELGKDGGLVVNPSEALLSKQVYACGCFWFQKKK